VDLELHLHRRIARRRQARVDEAEEELALLARDQGAAQPEQLGVGLPRGLEGRLE
jgi:hypothetical protein